MLQRFPLLIVCALFLCAFPAWAAEDDETYSLVQVSAPTAQAGLRLQHMGLDIVEAAPDGTLTLIARKGDLSTLSAETIKHEILIPDLESHLAQRLLDDPAVNNRDWPDGSMGGYFTNNEIEDELDVWAAQYPNLITPRMSIGTTVEGRDIWAVKISDNPGIDEDEPEICYDSLIHPREVMSLMTVLYYMKNLLEGYGSDPELTYLVDNREMWFIPVHNPDGHVYNETTNPGGGGMWRKNRRHNGGGIYGVDLARNYDFKWGYDNIGSSPDPNAIAYRGPSPFSEPEAVAVSDFILSRPIVTGWNTHTFTNVYICPFSYDNVLPYGDDWPLYQEYLIDIAIENGYPGGPSPYTLGYYANGTPLDWQYAEAGVFCLAPEIGTWDDFFWPPKSRIIPLAEESFLAISYWSWIAGSFVRLDDHTLSDTNKDGYYHPGEPVDVILDLRNKGFDGTATDVVATISSANPYIKIIKDTHNFGAIPGVANADNSSSPLKIKLDSKTPYGERIDLDVAMSFDGYTMIQTVSLVCGVPDMILALDMETNPGWTVGDTGDNATTGIWERANPIGTIFGVLPVQPEDDHTEAPGTRCFVTGNGSSSYDGDDVDDGKTTLKTSVFDLSGAENEGARISFWRWYADLGAFHSNNDLFVVDISNNGGGTWVNVEILDHTKNYWHEKSFKVSDFITPTDQMMMRFVARDEPDDSLCEACIDDFEIKTFDPFVDLALLGTPAIGSTVNIAIDAPSDSGLGYFMAASTITYPVIPIGERKFPLGWDFLLAPLSIKPGNGVFNDFIGYLNGAGYSADPEFKIPHMPVLIGVDIFFAAATLDAGYPDGIKNISAPLAVTVE
jgi:hypothetical protein